MLAIALNRKSCETEKFPVSAVRVKPDEIYAIPVKVRTTSRLVQSKTKLKEAWAPGGGKEGPWPPVF